MQLIILGKAFQPEHFLQIPVSIAFGWFIDLCMLLLDFVHPEAYWMKVVDLLIGCVILGIGVYMEVLANVIMLPGESFVRAVVYRWHTEFGITKVAFDVSMAVIAAVLSFVFAGQLDGVREGTVIAALLVGLIARAIGKALSSLPVVSVTVIFRSPSRVSTWRRSTRFSPNSSASRISPLHRRT